MNKKGFSILVITTIAFCAFVAGLYLGRNAGSPAVVVSVPAAMQTLPQETTAPVPLPTAAPVTFPININTADKETLMALPGIGEVYAQRIVDYREAFGPYKNVEALMNVEGIGETRMEAILDLITIGG